MKALPRRRNGDLTLYKPEEAKVRVAKADSLIVFAKKVKDWPLLEKAIDAKVEEQEEFVRWWRETVTPGHGGDRGKIPDRGSWSSEKAEELTGITPQQVSRWKEKLKDTPGYRGALMSAAELGNVS